MSRPRIGIPGRRAPHVSVLRYSGTIAAEAICEAIWQAGGEPLVFYGAAADPAAEVAERLIGFDGVLLPGGADLDPLLYGQQPHPETDQPIAYQDSFDLSVARAAIDGLVPLLAICRGMQVLNVALGGTLDQHVDESIVVHRDALHDVSPLPDTRLRRIVDTDRLSVSSYHHQAVRTVGAGLHVAAVADDGCVEALEHDTADLVAIQWHAEDLHASSPWDAALFADLVERAHQRKEVTV